MSRQFGYEGPRWVAYFWFVGWDCISLGVHVCLGIPNVELHLPFGFIRIGRRDWREYRWIASIVYADDDHIGDD